MSCPQPAAVWPSYACSRGAGLCCAILLSLAAAAPAQASCGHYVRRMGANFLPSAATQFTTASTAAKTPGDGASSANLALAPAPCSGPECQGAPRGRLPLPLSLAPPKGADRWAFDKREPPEASQAASWRWIESILLVLSDGFSLLPERPPKVS